MVDSPRRGLFDLFPSAKVTNMFEKNPKVIIGAYRPY